MMAPGRLASHYAPSAPVRLDAETLRPGERMLGFGAVAGDLTLSATGDLHEAAASLFAALHALDAMGGPIAVAPIPNRGLGRAIRDQAHAGGGAARGLSPAAGYSRHGSSPGPSCESRPPRFRAQMGPYPRSGCALNEVREWETLVLRTT